MIINKNVEHMVPEAFKSLPEGRYRLTKVENTRDCARVFVGNTVVGSPSIVEVFGLPAVKVWDDSLINDRYIRTSPIVEVVDTTDTTVTFKTEGGTYRLERME